MARSPKITINIGADTRRLRGDLKKADGIVGNFSRAASGAMLGLGVAAAGAAVAIGVEGVKAAIADQKEQLTLAKTLQNTTKATDDQVAAVEKYIEKTMYATGVTDTKLRASLDRLVRSTGNVTKAQKLQSIAIDVAAGTGKDLQTVSEAISKAYDGNYLGLNKLGGGIDAAIIKNKDFDGAMKSLAKTFEGQAEVAVNSLEGRMGLLQIRMDEAKESIGGVLLEGLEPLFDFMDSPEGQAFIDDFVVVFSESMKAVAEALPGILELIKKIGKVAGSTGLNFNDFMNPQMMAAAAAFRLSLPFGVPVAAVAAFAAYSIAGDSAETSRKQRDMGGVLAYNLKGPSAAYQASVPFEGSFSNMAMERRTGFNDPKRYASGYSESAVNYFTINAMDPAATARAVISAQNKAKRMGVSKYAGTS